MNEWDLFTKPLLNNFEHSILNLGATVAVVGMMEGLKYLGKGKHRSTKLQGTSGTLLITSSGFELFDQAFDRIQIRFRIPLERAALA